MICTLQCYRNLVSQINVAMDSLRRELLTRHIEVCCKANESQLNSGVLEGEALYQLEIIFKDTEILDKNSQIVGSIDIDIRPVKTEHSSAKEDMRTRDFTVNAMYYDIVNEQEEDYCDVCDSIILGKN